LFDIVQADFTTLQRELHAREIDLMIGRPSEPVSEEDIEAEVLFDDRIVFVAGSKNRWAGRRKIELAKLIDEPWSLPPVGSVPRSAIHEAFRAAGVDVPLPTVSSPAFQVHTHLLATGRFLTIMPESVVHFAAKDLPMKVLPVDLEIKLRPVLMIVLKSRTRSPVTDLFMRHAREIAKPLAKAN
jgi:DNA-binding transcriptional LysR family regulator